MTQARMFKVITKQENGEMLISFYGKVAEEAFWGHVSQIVQDEIQKAISNSVRELLEKPLKARVARELKKALGEIE